MLAGPFKQTGVGGDIKLWSLIKPTYCHISHRAKVKTRKGVRLSISLKKCCVCD